MESGIEGGWLYSAVRIVARYELEWGGERSIDGTGFLIRGPLEDRWVLMSNRHILDPAWKEEKWEGAKLLQLSLDVWSSNVTKVKIVLEPRRVFFHADESVDVAGVPFDMHTVVPQLSQKFILHNTLDWKMLTAALEDWHLFEACEAVYFPGYPSWYDRNGGRPIFRTGAIVSDPQTDYRRYDRPADQWDGNQQILFEAFSSDGNSGSPVFISRRGFTVGGVLYDGGVAHRSALLGINAGHYEIDDDAVETVDGKIILTNWHVGLSRMFKTQAVMDVALQACDQYDWGGSIGQ